MKQKIGDRPDDGAWIHSELDDYGLSQSEFRLYAHILRRSGTGGHYWESNQNAADHILMSKNTYQKALRALVGYGMVHCEKRKGQTTIITPLSKANWVRPSPAEKRALAKLNPTEPIPNEARGEPKLNPTEPIPNEARGEPKLNPTQIEPDPNEARPPIPNEAHEVYPYEVNPNEVNPSLSPNLSLQKANQERETIANAQKAKEGTASTVTALVPPETKSNPGQNIPKLKGQCSAAAPPPEIFEIKKWADFVGPGPVKGFWESAVRKATNLPERPVDAEVVAQTMIRNHGHLMWPKFEAAEAKRIAAEAAPPPPPPPPPQATPEAIAKLMQTLSLFPDDVLSTMRQLHPLCFNTLPKDPLEAWQRIGPGQRPLIHAYLLEQHAHAIPA